MAITPPWDPDPVYSSCTPHPTPIGGHQVYKHSLLCFGGYNGVTVLNDFYEYRFEPLVVLPPTLKTDLHSLINNPLLR